MVSLLPSEELELDLSATIESAKLLVATIHQLNERVKTLESEVKQLREEIARSSRHSAVHSI
jgi:FtsZ-binding cell division protein ZapB